MNTRFKMEYLRRIYPRYHRAKKKEKNIILDEFCNTCNYNRKYAIWLINQPPKSKDYKVRRSKDYTYTKETLSIIESIWKASGYLWSQRLKAALSSWLPYAKERFRMSPEVEKQLLSISTATIDRRLKDKRRLIKKRIYSSTRPGTLLKHQIPIKTDNWDVTEPGCIEIDLVSHGGSSEQGDFIHSLNCTDIHTQWTETRAIMGKGQASALKAIEDIENALPFNLKAIDPDNDSAFINYHLLTFCKKHKIQFTRSRPYKKDDNAHIEQKNWTNVRKIFGYLRYDTNAALDAMNDLYKNELYHFMNFFQPSVKLVKKIRIGSKLKRIYDKPKTPFQRVSECENVDHRKLNELKNLFSSLNPFELSEIIDQKLDKIFQMHTNINTLKKSLENRFYAKINFNSKSNFARYQHTNAWLDS